MLVLSPTARLVADIILVICIGTITAIGIYIISCIEYKEIKQWYQTRKDGKMETDTQ